MRQPKQLKRRLYAAVEPNYLLHIDDYDKLKPYGFAVHGAIDGYSIKILWLVLQVQTTTLRLLDPTS